MLGWGGLPGSSSGRVDGECPRKERHMQRRGAAWIPAGCLCDSIKGKVVRILALEVAKEGALGWRKAENDPV